MGSACGIVPLNSPGGSTVHCVAERTLLRITALAYIMDRFLQCYSFRLLVLQFSISNIELQAFRSCSNQLFYFLGQLFKTCLFVDFLFCFTNVFCFGLYIDKRFMTAHDWIEILTVCHYSYLEILCNFVVPVSIKYEVQYADMSRAFVAAFD